jgi:hypothetical protein
LKAVLLKNSDFLLTEDLLFIPVPNWEGWELILPRKMESMDHLARWEFYLYPKEERGWVFLRITWPSVSEIVLGFIYPEDRRILEKIALHRQLALTDQPLIEGQPYPFSKGVVVNDIPVDLLKVFGIGVDYGQNLIQ